MINLSEPTLLVADLHNKGGLSVLQSGFPAITNESAPYTEEVLYRYNPDTTDAVPAPAIVFKNYYISGGVNHPKLQIYNRGDRDFQKYRIYRTNPSSQTFILIDSSFTGDTFIDTTINLSIEKETDPENLFYYVNVIDNSFKSSISSDTIPYNDAECPGCTGSDNSIFVNQNTEETNSNSNSKEYEITNYPNPFNPVTQIYFNIPVEGNVLITVFNIAGQKVSELINEYKSAGSYKIDFNGSNFASGIYYYRIEAGSFSQVRKMILLK